jgi:hypothetical protein
MGTFFKGPFGGFSGTIGPLVGCSWKNLNVMRSQPGPRKGDPTPAQADQQAKFSLASAFLNRLKKLLTVTIPEKGNMSAYNIALQNVLYNAITGTSGAFGIDYTKVLLSRGDLPNATGVSMTSGATGKITWSWPPNGGTTGEVGTDQSILVAYSEDLNRSAFTLTGPARSTGTGALTIPAFSGKTVQTWLSFISVDGLEIAESVFTGQLTVQ